MSNSTTNDGNEGSPPSSPPQPSTTRTSRGGNNSSQGGSDNASYSSPTTFQSSSPSRRAALIQARSRRETSDEVETTTTRDNEDTSSHTIPPTPRASEAVSLPGDEMVPAESTERSPTNDTARPTSPSADTTMRSDNKQSIDSMGGSIHRSPQRLQEGEGSLVQSLSNEAEEEGAGDVPMSPVSRFGGSRFAGSFAQSLTSSRRQRRILGEDNNVADVGDINQNTDRDQEQQSQNTGGQARAAGQGESQEDNFEDEQLEAEGELALIRGTNIHVQTAARAFKDFIQNFISADDSEKVLRNARRRQKNKDGGGSDDSLSSDSDVEDSDIEGDREPIYMERLREILLGRKRCQTGENDGTITSSSAIETTTSLEINTLHLFYHSPQCQRLYHQLVSYPAEVVPLMDLIVSREMEALLHELHDKAVNAIEPEDYATLHPLSTPLPRIQVRPYHLKSLSHMRALDPNAIDSLLSIKGMVVRTSPIIPDLKVAHFSCSICAQSTSVTLERGRISEPTVCPNCNTRHAFQLIHNRSLFADKQMVRIQETPNEVPAGETPASIVLFAYDDLVDAVRPGDRVEVTGVFRAQARRVNPKITKVKSVYRTYIDVIHFRSVGGERKEAVGVESHKKEGDEDMVEQGKGLASENVGGKLSRQRICQLQELARSPDIYDKLVESLAPSIWELDDVKRGVLCMLFGGNTKRIKKGTVERRKGGEDSDSDEEGEKDGAGLSATKLYKRADINILLCGDPGTSKSQLLNYVHKLSPRGVYTSGKGSSAVGLTASIVRDPETREPVLESGALVLSDLGICCIDEFDKMSDTTRAILHEAMEQQTVSIAKAGIIATLNARTSILASANPVESRYNPQISVVDNIKLPPTLLSRFDLIYLILDAPNMENDRRLAQHLVGLYYDTPNVVQPPLDHDLFRDYILYARENIQPELSDLATRDLISAYLDMRRMGSGNGNSGSRTISATPRQLESLIRLSEALAKMRHSAKVERSDVKEAVRLMKVATQTAATDPRTGRIDMDMIATGRSTANREMEEALNISLKELLAERRGNRMAVADVRRQLSEIMNLSTVEQNDIIESLRCMEADGLIQFNERAQTIFVRAGVVS